MTPPSHIHLIGIGGTGLSAIARVLHESGYTVSGSDRQLSPLAASLREAGIQVFVGHAKTQVKGATLVVRSSAVPDDNVEVQAAREQGILVLKRADFLGELMRGHQSIAIAGSHGKTTTTAMASWAFTRMEQDPTFIVGGVVANLGINARAGQGPHFIIEADEYDRMFLGLRPDMAVVTNIEHDHPDCFPTAELFAQAFRDFAGCISPGGMLLACTDDPGAAALLDEMQGAPPRPISYGLGVSCEYRARNLVAQPGKGFTFDAFHHDSLLTHVALQVPGEHNVRNALAVLATAHLAGLSPEDCAAALAEFRGAGRRFDVQGEAGGVLVVDDYAHHPTEIRATLAAARQRYPGRTLWVVWQPHTYSRVNALSEGFRTAFADADHILVTDVYAARETAPPGFSICKLIDAMEYADARHIPSLAEVSAYLLTHMRSGDVLLTLSAGDAPEISQQVLHALQNA